MVNIENGNSNSYKMLEELENHDLFDNGEVVYFNPTTGKKCSKNDYTTNLNNYSTTNTLSDGTKSPTGLKSGCMKWYAFNDSIDNGLVNLILDHNTSGNVAWDSTITKLVMKEVAERLKSDTDSWSNSLIINKIIDNFDYEGYKARLITASEVVKITGADESLQWSNDKPVASSPVVGTSVGWFYLDGASGINPSWQTQVATTPGSSKFAWLFDNMYGCTDYGCNTADSNSYPYDTENSANIRGIYGYWTSTLQKNTKMAWNVHRGGNFNIYGHVGNSNDRGVRPVIMVNKEIFE